ncbi:hypothetical protein CYANOKiyG1_29260 [Okeania sp. KiyG1]|nr:hypothetical protein [Okeania sp. KiyG1]GGA15334.1 hypothetical protein CYANOKiyG1_29260 [Okeania sp. KiyG1]
MKLSTQQLLLQPQPQVRLLGFNNQVARIAVSSDKWQKMVMSKVASIEAGFEKVFKTAVKVKVEVTNTKGKNQSVSENIYPNNSKRERNITNYEKHQETSNYEDEIVENEP